MSINWQSDAEPSPALLVLPPAAASLDEAHAAIELWEHYSRKSLDPTQRLVVEVMMAETVDGKWAAPTTGREMPRQNGKGDEVEVVELWGLVQRAEAIMHTVHDAVLLASQTQQRMLGVLEGHADLRRLVKRTWRGTGQQMIEMRNGGVIWYRTRTGSGGRGVDDIDRLVIDEAQHATEEHLAAVSPTLFANDNPQMNVLGTAGIEGVSGWWWGMRMRALSPDPGDFGYVGHTAERVYLDSQGKVVQEPVDVHDVRLWMQSNPALFSGRGQPKEYFEEQLRRLPSTFAREHLCVWDPPPPEDEEFAWRVVTEDAWSACLDIEHQPTKALSWAVDCAPDGRSTAIGVSDGTHAELIEHRPGTAWAAERLVQLRHAHGFDEVVLDAGGPAGAILADLDAAGIPWRKVTIQEHAQACGALLEDVNDGVLRHIGQEPLEDAVRVAERRNVGDVWLWTRTKSAGDIAPLVCITLAHWAARQVPEELEPVPTPGFVDLSDYLDEE